MIKKKTWIWIVTATAVLTGVALAIICSRPSDRLTTWFLDNFPNTADFISQHILLLLGICAIASIGVGILHYYTNRHNRRGMYGKAS
jgi:hypothetical protein